MTGLTGTRLWCRAHYFISAGETLVQNPGEDIQNKEKSGSLENLNPPRRDYNSGATFLCS